MGGRAIENQASSTSGDAEVTISTCGISEEGVTSPIPHRQQTHRWQSGTGASGTASPSSESSAGKIHRLRKVSRK